MSPRKTTRRPLNRKARKAVLSLAPTVRKLLKQIDEVLALLKA